ncbi:MAG: diguanylate cyclase domain-containing protein [Lachnospira sp.]
MGNSDFIIDGINDEVMDQTDNFGLSNAELSTYLSLTHCFCLSYKIHEDALNIFFMSDLNMPLETYSGKLADWRNEMLSNDRVDSKSFDNFESLCTSLENGEKFILEKVTMSLIDEDDKRKTLVTGKTCDVDGQPTAYCVLTLLNDTRNVNDDEDTSDKLDSETGILDASAITDYARKQIVPETQEYVMLAVVELDNFELVKETYGDDFALDVIQRSANVVKEAVGMKGKCGRIGEHSMLIVVKGLITNEEQRNVLRAVNNNIKWLYNLGSGNDSLKITCSIGASSYPVDGHDYDTIFSLANSMLDLAKAKGMNKYIIYHEDLHHDFILGGKAVDAKDKRFFKHRKIRSVNMFIREFFNADQERKNSLIEMFALSMNVENVMLYDRTNKKKVNLFGEDKTEESIDFLDKDNFIPSFREDGLFVIDSIELYETKNPTMYNVCTKAGIHQAIHYVVGGNISQCNDIVVSCYRYTQSRKWTETEINYIAIFGEILGNEYRKGLE